MEVAVDMHLVVFGLLSALAAVSVLVHLALRAGSALAWLAATMVCVGAETLVFRYAADTMLGLAAISLLLPLAYLCAAQAIRRSMGLGLSGRWPVAGCAALTALSLLLLAFGAPPLAQSVPFQLAGVVVFLDAVVALARQRDRDMLGTALLVLCICSLAGIAIRVPMFPLLLGEPTPFPIMDRATFEQVFVHSLSVLTSGLALLVIARIVANELARHRQLAERDDLTGLLNRRVFDEVIHQPAPAAGAVVMCDIDHFKAVNDGHGHHVGDEVIRSFACILGHHGDYVGRVGGEEFALVLFGVDLREAEAQAEAMRTFFHELRHPLLSETTRLSASFGVSAFEAGIAIDGAMQRADKALYIAKRDGRNRVCVARDDTPVGFTMQHAA